MLKIPFKFYDKNYVNPDYVKDNINLSDSSEEKGIKPNKEIQKEEETIMKDIICNLPYMLICLYRGNRLFIFVTINFRYSDYLQNSLMEKKPRAIFWSYSITMVWVS